LTIYFISGLAADRQMFRKLQLPDAFRIVHLAWQEPERGETMLEYCQRFVAFIDRAEPFALVGLSYGGMIAVELSRMVQPRHTIILSSCGSSLELPPFLRMAGALALHKIFNVRFLKIPSPYAYWLFDTKTEEEKELLRDILKSASVPYLRWAVRCILKWKRKEKPEGIYHIHGSKDRVLPVRYTKPDAVVEGGGHFMVFGMAETVSSLLRDRLCL
jgi:pimeloyl-ACP methyl ester carboxylesterase